jgi:hypothetical protein
MPATASRLLWCVGIAAIVILLLCPYMHAQKDADKDQDGIPDLHDNCPYIVNQDQVDNDKDGLGDACDTCPYEYGPASNNGCPEKAQPTTEPDKDQDGIPDSQDNCPFVVNQGQADNDKDGLGDACDTCPYEYGPASNNGCPEKAQPTTEDDSDKDGLLNSQDSCPYDYGPASNNGCPEKAQPVTETDSDKDGVPDSQDNCPIVYNPDQAGSDKDSVGDACDKCPKDVGPASNSGCPVTTGTTVPMPVASAVVPRITTTITPAPAPAAPNPPGMVINVLTAFDPAGPGTSTIRARADAPGVPRLISIFVDNQQRRDCTNIRDCIAIVPDLNNGSNVGVLVFNNNNQAGASGNVPADARVRPDLDRDDDGDGIPNYRDNCPAVANRGQEDTDQDRVGDACDQCDPRSACARITSGPVLRGDYVCNASTTNSREVIRYQTGDVYYYERLYTSISRSGCGCQDPDGMNYFTPGSVYVEHVNAGPYTEMDGATLRAGCRVESSCAPAATDTCIDGSRLSEMYCGPAGPSNVTIRCPEGCTNGACECPDTDGGWNYYVAGSVYNSDDVCSGPNAVTEYACILRNGVQEAGSRTFQCPYGCANGACQCSDSDGRLNYNVQGHVGVAGSGLDDYCLDNRRLVEIDVRQMDNLCARTNTTHQCEGLCRNGACLPPTCSDGILNQGETDVDAGGPCAPVGRVKIKGTLLYEEDDAGPGGTILKPVRGVTIGLLPSGGTQEDDLIPEGYSKTVTNSQGYFQFIVPRNVGAYYLFKFKPTNWAATIEKDFDGCDEWVYFTASPRVPVPATGEDDIGRIIVPKNSSRALGALPGTTLAQGYWLEDYVFIFCGTDPAWLNGGSAYFNLAEDIAVARTWADGHRAGGDDTDTITQALVQYPDSHTPMYNVVYGEISLNSDFGGDPGLQDSTVVHEFGHQLEDDIAMTAWSGGAHELCTVRHEEFAMSEGFAEFFSALITNRYRNDPERWMSQERTSYHEIERPNCTTMDNQVPLLQRGNPRSYDNINWELWNAALMWDLIDTPGSEYPDAHTDEHWDNLGGAANEEAVFKIFDKEFDNFFDAPDICQFVWGRYGWKNRFAGRPEAALIDPILAANNITNAC